MKDKYYQQVMCSEELPKENGEYIAFSKCNSDTESTYAYAESMAFKNGHFKEVPNWTTLWWLKPIDPIELAWDECAKVYDQHNIDWCLWNIKDREGDEPKLPTNPYKGGNK